MNNMYEHGDIVNGFKVIKYVESEKYLVVCPVCGNEKIIRRQHFKVYKSCGCRKGNIKHGLDKNHPIYFKWNDMKNRCYNKNRDRYNAYGARGIKVCDEWINDYKAFYDWVISNGWKPKSQIDRIDNDGDYTPNNCRIVEKKQNMRNMQHTRWVKFNGDDVCLAEACEKLNVGNRGYYYIHSLMQRGFSFDEAVIINKDKRAGKFDKYYGKPKSFKCNNLNL